jgi:hypothetical protein
VGNYHAFEFTYVAATGVTTFKIDFNRDNDFLDAQESASSTSPTLAGFGHKYLNLWMSGSANAPGTVDVQNFTVNGTNLGGFTSNPDTTPIEWTWADSSGIYGDVTVTGEYRMSATGSAGESNRMWVRLGGAQAIPFNVVSAQLNFSSTGWGGWSCPTTHRIQSATLQKPGGGAPDYPATIYLWKPGATVGAVSYPFTPFGYTYTPPEEGAIVQNDATPQSLQLVLTCVPPDTTAPTAAPTQDPPANGAGWNNSDVTVTWNWTDTGGSGIDTANCTVSSTSVGEGEITLNATCKDLAGNEGSAEYTVKVDITNPTISGSASPAAVNGWNNTDVTVSFSCADNAGGSGIDIDNVAGATLSTEGAGQLVTNTGACVDKAGNVADPATVSGINIDKTKPTISGSASPAAVNGWNNTDVTVSFSCADNAGGSDVDINTVTGATLSTEGAGQLVPYTGTCVDKAGNEADPATVSGINIDKTKPTLGPSVSPNPVVLNGAATVTSNASDALSGIATDSCDPVDTSSLGSKTVTCTATDFAGNTNSASATYLVSVNPTKAFVRASLASLLPTGNKQNDDRIKKAIESIDDSLKAEYWSGPSTLTDKGKKVFDEEKKAVQELQKVTGIDVSMAITSLVQVDRALAQAAINSVVCGTDTKCQKEIVKAQQSLAAGDAQSLPPKPDPDKAIDNYKKAWETAVKAK